MTQAKSELSVPAPTIEQKYNMTKIRLKNNVLGLITAAKKDGITAAKLGKKSATEFFPVWEENGEYDQFVQFLLNAWSISCYNVKIIDKSDDKLLVKVSSIYKQLENKGELYGSTIEDYTAFFNALANEIAVQFDQSIKYIQGSRRI